MPAYIPSRTLGNLTHSHQQTHQHTSPDRPGCSVMSLHHLTPPHIPHVPSLLLDVQRLSSVLSSVRHGASGRPCVLSSRIPLRMCISHPIMLACRRRPLDTGTRKKRKSHEYVALWSTVRAHRRHGRSLVQRPSHLDTPLAGPCKSPLCLAGLRGCSCRALLTTQPMSLSLVHASPHARPYTARDPEGRRGVPLMKIPGRPSG
jgi:hypothetical protein